MHTEEKTTDAPRARLTAGPLRGRIVVVVDTQDGNGWTRPDRAVVHLEDDHALLTVLSDALVLVDPQGDNEPGEPGDLNEPGEPGDLNDPLVSNDPEPAPASLDILSGGDD